MGYSLSLPLTSDAPIDLIKQHLNNSKFIKNYVYISSEYDEHGYPVPYEKAIYASYSGPPPVEQYYLFLMFETIAEIYGRKILNLLDNTEYPFYNYDHQYTLILPIEKYEREKRRTFYSSNGKIITNDEVVSISKENEEHNAQIEILFFSLTYIPNKIKYPHMFIPEYDQKPIEEAYADIQNFKKTLIEHKNKSS